MDFSAIKKLTIGGIELKQLFINGIQVWKSFTNQVRQSIASDKTPFNGGLGYWNGQELSGSSGSQRAGTGYTCTGFIPVKQGDVIRIKGCNWYSTKATNYIVAYTSTFVHWGTTTTGGGHYYGNTTYNPNKFAIERPACNGSMDIQPDVSTIVIARNAEGVNQGFENIAYIRLSVRGDGSGAVDGADLIVTVNEEIT